MNYFDNLKHFGIIRFINEEVENEEEITNTLLGIIISFMQF